MMPDPAPLEVATTTREVVEGVVYCPECGMPAWVEWRDTARSTSGPVELVKIHCFARHWYLMPAADLAWGLDAA